MTKQEITHELDHIIGLNSLQSTESQLSTQISSLLGRRTLAMVEVDASFDPDQYDPALDEADFLKQAA